MNGEQPDKDWAHWWACRVIESKHCTLSGPARDVLLYLAGKANAAHYCFPSKGLIERALRKAPRTVTAAIAELVAAGLVMVFAGGQGPRTPNGYWLAVGGVTPTAKGCSTAPLSLSTRGADEHPIDIHKGCSNDTVRGADEHPELTSEVSRKRARVFSPPSTRPVEDLLAPFNSIGGRR